MQPQGKPSRGGLIGGAAGNVADAGGALTEDELFAAAAAVMERPPEPAFILTSMGTIEEGRRQAERSAAVASWAWKQLQQTGWWRPLRRRFLRRTFDRHAYDAEMLWATFGVGDE